jgi:putative two-component system response regulator
MIETNALTLLIIDDSPELIASLSALLRPYYRVLAARTAEAGLAIANRQPAPDLILLDIVMPETDGFAVLAKLKASFATRKIPVVFLTALTGPDEEERGLEVGASDYVTKPIKPAVLLARVRNQMEAKLARDWLEDNNAALEAEIARRTGENNLTQKVAIRALAHLAEMRDEETGNHILRTRNYVRLLATLLREHPRFRETLTNQYIDLLTVSAPLHDIGKVGIPDHILLKPGKLTPDEWEIMKTHSALGSDAIERAERDIEQPLPFLKLAKEIARWQHEKWNGEGYPDGLVGDAIPVSARLMAVADAFDALTSRRVYKPKISFDEAREIIAQGRGAHFDPDVVDAFLAHYEQFASIARHYSDG